VPRYLDPKADVVFKKIFCGHPHLLKSFLNALLPLSADQLIETLEYLSSEQVPVIPTFKYTVVDVRCKDAQGRSFIVEMQIQWTTGFMQRMLFNASNAYVRQLYKGEDYRLLQPVYGIGLINSQFDPDPEYWYHHYKIVNVEKPQAEIKDLQLVFIELPKFKPATFSEKKLQVLWLRFMSELNANTRKVPAEWLAVPEIREAIQLAEEAAYTEPELAAYDKYWDAVSSERTLMSGSFDSGKTEGIKIGKAEGIEIGEAKGIEKGRAEVRAQAQQEKLIIARKLLDKGIQKQEAAALTGLLLSDIEMI
jgi:predicted transposase/invertase (TIGR01784 family)